MRPQSVVTSDAGLRGAAEIERRRVLVGVRPGGRVDDRVRAVDDLELVIAPARTLGALVRAVPDLGRLVLRERRRGIGRVEDELDHLPVALVGVVEVVEGVEEPVLQRELARLGGVGGDVRVDRGLVAGRQPPRPSLVVAAGVERVAREVEVVLVEPGDVLRRRPDLHEVGRVPRAAQCDGRLAEDAVDVHRLVRLPGPALLGLLHEADDGGVAVGERPLVARAPRRQSSAGGARAGGRRRR